MFKFVAGLVGTTIAMITIISQRKKSMFQKLLVTLAAFDTIFIVNGGLFMMTTTYSYNSYLINVLVPKIIYPLSGIGMTGIKQLLNHFIFNGKNPRANISYLINSGSSYSCVAIAIERYVGICYPHLEADRKFRHYLGGIVITTLAIDVVR